MKINEKDITKIVKESVLRLLQETNRIQPWKGNPLQIDPNWADVRKRDEELAAQLGDKKAPKRSAVKNYGDIKNGSVEDMIISHYQDEISKNAVERAKGKTGTSFISQEQLKYEPETVRNVLSAAGMEIGLRGKTFSFGNKKLPPSTMIVNITSSFGCPSQKNCAFRDICYAKKLVSKYGRNAELRDMRNQFTFPYLTTREILKLLELYIEFAPIRIHDIRISEAGDFQTQEQVDFCDKIAGHLKAKYGINTTVYTNAVNLDFSNVKNMIINASNMAVKGADRYFLARPKSFMANIPATNKVSVRKVGNKEEPFFRCCGDCHICRFCYNTREQNGETGEVLTRVYEKIH